MTCPSCFSPLPLDATVCYACEPAAEEQMPSAALPTATLLGSDLFNWLVARFTPGYRWADYSEEECDLALAARRGWSLRRNLLQVASAVKAKEDQTAADEAARKAEREARLVGKHYGIVGEKFDFPALLCVAIIPLGENEYNGRRVESILAKFITPEGDQVVWFTSVGVKMDPQVDKKYKVSAIVKSHSDYNGERQTTITRASGEEIAD